jgi:hypothetical protein
VVVPLPNEINAVRCLKAITRALNDLAFSRRWLTKLSTEARPTGPRYITSLFVYGISIALPRPLKRWRGGDAGECKGGTRCEH